MQPQLKTSLAGLSDLPRLEWHEGSELPNVTSLLHYRERGRQFDYIFHPNPEHRDRLYVLFSGDALRKKFKPPVFQRWSWAKYFPGHCLYVSDPCLFMKHDLALGWYCGTEAFDVMESIARRIDAVRATLAVAENRVFGYGSSGGGYAALRLLTFAPQAAAIAINPQTSIPDYQFNAVEKYLDLCFGGISREEARTRFSRRFSICENADLLRNRRILLVQNTLDLHHYEVHYEPLCEALGVDPGHETTGRNSTVLRFLFAEERGHAAAEPPEVFARMLDLMQKDLI